MSMYSSLTTSNPRGQYTCHPLNAHLDNRPETNHGTHGRALSTARDRHIAITQYAKWNPSGTSRTCPD
ncbi:unnamed protein product [Macrosiphum euphorbiae]|uniref:Uncharacterized protein n=1 Tax=Macrosiphum euphorbiae TaxID=13131 RepID=A0AAV0XFJ8_9HEMI|nr:unnamed protein product [Macrosiphum euphorbiae]